MATNELHAANEIGLNASMLLLLVNKDVLQKSN